MSCGSFYHLREVIEKDNIIQERRQQGNIIRTVIRHIPIELRQAKITVQLDVIFLERCETTNTIVCSIKKKCLYDWPATRSSDNSCGVANKQFSKLTTSNGFIRKRYTTDPIFYKDSNTSSSASVVLSQSGVAIRESYTLL